MATQRALSRIAVNAALDGLLAAFAVPAARWLTDPMGDPFTPFWTLPWGAVALLLAGLPFGLSFQYWRFAGVGDLLGVAAASVATAAIFPVAVHAASGGTASLALPAAHALVLMVLLAIPRIAYRIMQETPGEAAETAQSALLVGANEGADLFIRAISGDRHAAWRVSGLLSLGSSQTGRRIQGHPILGSIAEADGVLDRLRAQQRLPAALIVTDPDLGGREMSGLMEIADRHGLRVLRAPRPAAIDPTLEPNGGERRLELKPVAIEDLLNRPQVPLDRAGMARLVQGRRVLVTGAGGTIGSELARQVAALGPEELILLDHGEYALWQIDMELAETAAHVRRQTVLADVRDQARIMAVMEQSRPHLVFHAAALKHVPMVEANPLEGIRTNANGTRHVADAARATGAVAMVLISTDKAVNPSSVMGASKRLAEMYCQAQDIAARGAAGGLRCITVRFGNVLGSTGSVVPVFQHQLARGGPLTVTHPDMQRYFMTVREAVGLVLQASVVGVDNAATAMREGGATREGGIFVLDMGEPVKIVELARQMIRLAGLRPERDIAISFTGLRPGEKLFEELFHGQEPPVPTGTPGLLMAAPRTADPAIVARAIDEIAAACRNGQNDLALKLLGRIVPEFDHAVLADTAHVGDD